MPKRKLDETYCHVKARNREAFRSGRWASRRSHYPLVEGMDIDEPEVQIVPNQSSVPAQSENRTLTGNQLVGVQLAQPVNNLTMVDLLVQLKNDSARHQSNQMNEAVDVSPDAARRQMTENLAELNVKKPMLADLLELQKTVNEAVDELRPQVNYLEIETMAARALRIEPYEFAVPPPPIASRLSPWTIKSATATIYNQIRKKIIQRFTFVDIYLCEP